MVTYTDVVEFLSGSSVPSPLGSMLDKIRDGTSGIHSSGKNNEEYRILSQAQVLRCVDNLRNIDKIEFENCPSIKAFAKKTECGEGALVLAVLGSYHRWFTKSEMRGLVEIYRLCQKLDSSLPEPYSSEVDTTQGFRTGKTKKARDLAAKLLKDSMLVIDTWVKEWNKEERKVRYLK